MNKIQKSDFDTSFSFDYYPDKELSSSDKGINIFIKHDYYSSDNEHGRDLLAIFLSQISESNTEIRSVMIVDQGVKLLSENNSIYNEIIEIINKSTLNYINEDSLNEYGITLSEELNVVKITSDIFFEELLHNKPDIIIE